MSPRKVKLIVFTSLVFSAFPVTAMIESISGGFRFPDGTVQSSAAVAAGINNSIVTGFPDLIQCNLTNPNYGLTNLLLVNAPFSDGNFYYSAPYLGASNRNVSFYADGTFAGYANITTSDCNVSIATLYATGRAFNFAKGPAAQWLQSGGNAYYNAGNVGVGTNAPAAKLEVTGTSGGTLRIADGNQGAGKILTSDANGQASWQASAGGGGGVNYAVVTSPTTMSVNQGYIANGTSSLNLTLPTTCAVGDKIHVASMNTGGWKVVQQNTNHQIYGGTFGATPVGPSGYLASLSGNKKDAVQMVCAATNDKWVVVGVSGYIGNCSNATVVFDYTGADQTATVPTGCGTAAVKAWGAGGGGGNNQSSSPSGIGGGGAFVTGSVAVTTGESLTVIVGGGGGGGAAGGYSTATYGGGGGGGYSSPGQNTGGTSAGGGRSALRRGGADLITAGGGGGGCSYSQGSAYGGAGGGGNPVGPSPPCGAVNGYGASVSAGGAGGIHCNVGPGDGTDGGAGTAYTGGNGGQGGYNTYYYYFGGAGGGGGYFGGGGGGGGASGSGGGGSNFVPAGGNGSPGLSGAAPNQGDASYTTGIGMGGVANTAGGNGRVVITWGP